MTLVDLVKKVLTSWQVLAVTVAIILYFFLVSAASRSYRRPKSSKSPKIKTPKKKKADAAVDPNASGDSGSGAKDELGIEEA